MNFYNEMYDAQGGVRSDRLDLDRLAQLVDLPEALSDQLRL